MAVGPILTQGLGSFGSVNLLPTLGYGIAAAVVNRSTRLNSVGQSRERVTLTGASQHIMRVTGQTEERISLTGNAG